MTPRHAIERLQSFRRRVILSLGEKIGLSEALWFATWSGNSAGDLVARFICEEIGLFHFLRRFGHRCIKSWARNLVHRREIVSTQAPGFNVSTLSGVYQTWLSDKEASSPVAFIKDRYFGPFFSQALEDGKASPLVIQLNQASSDQVLQGVMLYHTRPAPVTAKQLFRDLTQTVKAIIYACFKFRGESWRETLATLGTALLASDSRNRHACTVLDWANSLLRECSQKIPVLYLAYEAQPEQTALTLAWQKAGGRVVGYIHSTMLTFPGHYIRPPFGAPDELLVHGNAYPSILMQCGWERERIRVIPSLRYRVESAQSPEPGTVALPYVADGLDFSIRVITDLVRSHQLMIKSIRAHPLTGISEKYRTQLDALVEYSTRSLTRDCTYVVTVGPISLPLEILEKKPTQEVVHVPLSRSFFDRFDNGLWENDLECMSMNEATLLRLRYPGAFILMHGIQPNFAEIEDKSCI